MKRHLLTLFAVVLPGFAVVLSGCASVQMEELRGTVSYRERMALPPEAEVRVAIEDVSKADAASQVVAEQVIHPATQVPIPFVLGYDANAIAARNRYALVAEIRDRDNTLLWRTDTALNPFAADVQQDDINLLLKRVGGKNKPLPTWHYRCDDVTFTFAPGIDENARLYFDNRTYQLKRVPSASGARYEGEGLMFWSKGRDGMLNVGGKTYEGCTGEAQ